MKILVWKKIKVAFCFDSDRAFHDVDKIRRSTSFWPKYGEIFCPDFMHSSVWVFGGAHLFIASDPSPEISINQKLWHADDIMITSLSVSPSSSSLRYTTWPNFSSKKTRPSTKLCSPETSFEVLCGFKIVKCSVVEFTLTAV